MRVPADLLGVISGGLMEEFAKEGYTHEGTESFQRVTSRPDNPHSLFIQFNYEEMRVFYRNYESWVDYESLTNPDFFHNAYTAITEFMVFTDKYIDA